MEADTLYCPAWCDAELPRTAFSPNAKQGKYCIACTLRYDRGERVPRRPRVCAECDTTFTPKYNRVSDTAYCSARCGVRANRRQQTARRRAKPKPPCVCQECSTTFTPTYHAAQKYCSKECRNKATTRRARPPEPAPCVCLGCGTTFTPKYNRKNGVKYCSIPCAGKYQETARAQRVRDNPVIGAMQAGTCEVCGETFERLRKGAHEITRCEFCSKWARECREYGLTGAQVEEYRTSGECGFCGLPQSEFDDKLRFDHNHQTGAFRGLLCGTENSGLGLLGDDPLDAGIRLLAYGLGIRIAELPADFGEALSLVSQAWLESNKAESVVP